MGNIVSECFHGPPINLRVFSSGFQTYLTCAFSYYLQIIKHCGGSFIIVLKIVERKLMAKLKNILRSNYHILNKKRFTSFVMLSQRIWFGLK